MNLNEDMDLYQKEMNVFQPIQYLLGTRMPKTLIDLFKKTCVCRVS